MKCIYCNTPLSSIDYCTGCGADITIQKRIVRISNLLYNEGLEKATVRDLSGAITCLKRSLKFNKENIDARNLLGLVYFESGEVVSALSEWVISKNLNVPDNAADGYIAKLQGNKNKLDTINQTIRKYNYALEYCRQDNEDMAAIQLKKVLSQNPRLIKGYHLLALLYLKRQEYEKARKLLKKAIRVDKTNTTTLRYLKEIEEATGISTSLDMRHRKRYAKDTESQLTGPGKFLSGNDLIIQPTPFRDSSTVATFINIFLGLILGGAIVWFLAVPSNTQNINMQANKQVTDANTKLASETAKNQKLLDEIEDYKKQVEEAEKTMDAADKKAESYDKLLEGAGLFIAGDMNNAAKALEDVSGDSLEGVGKDLYDKVTEGIKPQIYAGLYSEGTVAYTKKDYTTAIEKLTKAVEIDPAQYDAIYYLAFSYFNSGDKTNADKILNEVIQKFPDKAADLSQYLSGSGAAAETEETNETPGEAAQPEGTPGEAAQPAGTPVPEGAPASP